MIDKHARGENHNKRQKVLQGIRGLQNARDIQEHALQLGKERKNPESAPRPDERVEAVFRKRYRKDKKGIGKKIKDVTQYTGGKMEIKKAIKNYAETQKDILCIYLFGSTASGKENKFSDVDVAILFDDTVSREKYSERALSIMDGLSAVLDRNVDIVVLNTANSFLKFRAIKTGIRLYERPNRGSRFFEARSVIEYFDFFPIKEMLEKALVDNIRRG